MDLQFLPICRVEDPETAMRTPGKPTLLPDQEFFVYVNSVICETQGTQTIVSLTYDLDANIFDNLRLFFTSKRTSFRQIESCQIFEIEGALSPRERQRLETNFSAFRLPLTLRMMTSTPYRGQNISLIEICGYTGLGNSNMQNQFDLRISSILKAQPQLREEGQRDAGIALDSMADEFGATLPSATSTPVSNVTPEQRDEEVRDRLKAMAYGSSNPEIEVKPKVEGKNALNDPR